MVLNEGLDTGDMLLAHKVAILPDTTAPELFKTLSDVGAHLMVETLRRLKAGDLQPASQDHALATHAPLLTRADGQIDFNRTARQIYDRWRGFQPWPGAFSYFRGKRMVVHRLCIHNGVESDLQPGAITLHAGKFLVGCGGGSILELLELQIEGKARVTAAEFARGYQVHNAEQLGG
jgi:methionyl-tRNA formyltransferase